MSSLGKFTKVYLALGLVILMQCQDTNAKSIPQLLRNMLQTLQKIEKRLSSPLQVVPFMSMKSGGLGGQSMMMQPKGLNYATHIPNSELAMSSMPPMSRVGKIPMMASQENAAPMDDEEALVQQTQEVEQDGKEKDSKEGQDEQSDSPLRKSHGGEPENVEEGEEEQPPQLPSRRFIQKPRRRMRPYYIGRVY